MSYKYIYNIYIICYIEKVYIMRCDIIITQLKKKDGLDIGMEMAPFVILAIISWSGHS